MFSEEIEKLLQDLAAKISEQLREEQKEWVKSTEHTTDQVTLSALYHSVERKYQLPRVSLRALFDNIPTALFLILLKELQTLTEKELENLNEVYTVNVINGAIKVVHRDAIKKFSNLPVFRSWEEALKAKEMLRIFTEQLYGKC